MFDRQSDDGFRPAIEGIDRKTRVYGEKTLLAEFRLRKDSAIPSHAHPHEQTGYLVRGHMLFTVGTEKFDARTGDAWCIPGNVEHSAVAVEDSIVVEAFSPLREDYLPGQ